jgi:hypothetical protein
MLQTFSQNLDATYVAVAVVDVGVVDASIYVVVVVLVLGVVKLLLLLVKENIKRKPKLLIKRK